jgi:hypothetical protein
VCFHVTESASPNGSGGHVHVGLIAMCGRIAAGIVVGLAGLLVPGCVTTHEARYVYQDSQFGVVAIPKNTTEGPYHYREQAESLMAQHFPDGYEIIRAEEVVEGSRTVTRANSGSTEFSPQVTPHVLALLKVGGSATRSQADTLNLKECRIIYKKADPGSTAKPGTFAAEASLKPTCYVDPNTLVRKSDEKEKAPAKGSEAKTEPELTRVGIPPAGG